MKNDFYVYAWLRPCGTPFYIGKGRGRRASQAKAPGNILFRRTVEKIRGGGGEPIIVKWQEGLREEDALSLESAYIKLFGRKDICTGVLSNLTDGGEGTAGCVAAPHVRRRLSEAQKENWLRPGRKEKSSESLKRLWQDGDFRARQVSSHIRAFSDEEVKMRVSDGLKRAFANPEILAKKSLASKEVNSRPEVLAIKKIKSANLRKMEGPRGKTYKGVVPRGKGDGWLARIKVDKKNFTYGPFSTQEDAAKAYDAAAFAAWGHDCYLNFPKLARHG